MQVVELNRANAGANIGLVAGMHRLRRKVFKDRLAWAVCTPTRAAVLSTEDFR